jgi:hypothetical protein
MASAAPPASSTSGGRAGRADSRAMAARLVLLVDGAIVTSVRERSADAAEVARGIAAVLLAEPAPVNAQ